MIYDGLVKGCLKYRLGDLKGCLKDRLGDLCWFSKGLFKVQTRGDL